MRKRSEKSAQSKREWVIGASDRVFVGLDVHKKSYHAAVRVNGQEVATTVLAANPDDVVRYLEPYRAGVLHVAYEAGPTGYALVRRLRAAGVAADVIAPNKTPRAPCDAAKSDRLDCRKLAHDDEKGDLKPVAVPTEQEEADRQVGRLQEQLIRRRRVAKQHIKSFLLQHGLKEPEGLNHWTRASVAALREMPLGLELRFCLDALLEDLRQALEFLKEVEKRLRAMARQPRLAARVARVDAHPGVGAQTAMHFVLELHQPERFDNGEQVSAYLGLAPRVRSSGQQRKEGPLLKAGRGPLRAMLVEASWTWIRVDAKARAVFGRLWGNTGCPQKAIVAMARRLAVRLWHLLIEPAAPTTAPA